MQHHKPPKPGRRHSPLFAIVLPLAYMLLLVAAVVLVPPGRQASASRLGATTPATLAQPYAKLCFAPEWWLVKGYLLDTGTLATAQPLGTLAEANSIFCTGTTDTPAVHRHWQADADRTLERLKLEMAELPVDPDLLVAITRVHVLQKIVNAL